MRTGRWGGALVLAATAGCLPQGPPPQGRHLLADRGASMAGLVPPNGDGLLRLLLLRPGSTTDTADLSVVSLDQANQLSPELPLISDILLDGVGCGVSGPAPCGVWPSATLQVQRADRSYALVDTITGDVQPISQEDAVFRYTTPGGRSFRTDDSFTTGTLTDRDGHTTPITLGRSSSFGGIWYQFVGEDFCYVDPQQSLIDVPPSGVVRQLATDVVSFTGTVTPQGPMAILTRSSSSAVLDISSGVETALPVQDSSAQFSADGRWVLETEAASPGTFTFVDVRAGVQQTVQIDGYTRYPVNRVPRPGTSEFWVNTFESPGSNAHPTTWVLRPGSPPVMVPETYLEDVPTNGLSAQPFTADGTYWFFTAEIDSAMPVIQVGLADDPTGPAFPLNPPSTFMNLALPVTDGRILTTAYAKNQDRSDVSLIDPRTGQTDVVARRGLLLTSGTTRAMGLFHVVEARGDLTTIDLDTEATTVLAPEFAMSAVAEPRGTDALAPGRRIIYQFQARSASPYDGLWLTTCP